MVESTFSHIYGLLNENAIVGVFEYIWSENRIWIPNDELLNYTSNGFYRQI